MRVSCIFSMFEFLFVCVRYSVLVFLPISHIFSFMIIFQVMLDTIGPELLVVTKTEHPISLLADESVVLTPDQDKEATSNLLPINFSGLSKVFTFFHFSLCAFWASFCTIVLYVLHVGATNC